MSLIHPPEANQKAERIALPPILLFLFIKKIMINTLGKIEDLTNLYGLPKNSYRFLI